MFKRDGETTEFRVHDIANLIINIEKMIPLAFTGSKLMLVAWLTGAAST